MCPFISAMGHFHLIRKLGKCLHFFYCRQPTNIVYFIIDQMILSELGSLKEFLAQTHFKCNLDKLDFIKLNNSGSLKCTFKDEKTSHSQEENIFKSHIQHRTSVQNIQSALKLNHKNTKRIERDTLLKKCSEGKYIYRRSSMS